VGSGVGYAKPGRLEGGQRLGEVEARPQNSAHLHAGLAGPTTPRYPPHRQAPPIPWRTLASWRSILSHRLAHPKRCGSTASSAALVDGFRHVSRGRTDARPDPSREPVAEPRKHRLATVTPDGTGLVRYESRIGSDGAPPVRHESRFEAYGARHERDESRVASDGTLLVRCGPRPTSDRPRLVRDLSRLGGSLSRLIRAGS
jgi:hypothetical protein